MASMENTKWVYLGAAGLLFVAYNMTQPGLMQLRNNEEKYPGFTGKREAYGPSLEWLDRLARSAGDKKQIQVDQKTGELEIDNVGNVKLDFSVLSSVMVAGLASGFKSQVANLLWMKSDEYWHQGLFTRQVPLMEAVVTLDPQFIDAWSTAGWHWAYNIYADIPTNPAHKAKGEQQIRRLQQNAVDTGLDYLKRGANLNPDTYRLWFEWGWTRAEKAGYYDDETLALYKEARKKVDAREMERTVQDSKGNTITEKVQGIDLMGRTIGHLLERIPRFQDTQDWYGEELLGLKRDSEDRKLLDDAGRFWRQYGTDYRFIGEEYQKGDANVKARIKSLVPNVERLIAAHEARMRIGGQPGSDQPVGAYVTIQARYMPAWNMAESGNLEGAIADMVGVMNADPKYTLKGLPVLAQVLELRGDGPTQVKAAMDAAREAEKVSSQDLGLHFLATLYERAAAQVKGKDEKKFMAYNRLAYETWYRSRERDALDFYALRKTRNYQDLYKFPVPQAIVKSIKDSRQKGVPNAAPPVPPNVQNYYR